ncbi:hypothetical protein FSP39_008748 [Pinctada imbricata]|uniref:DBF4-type domain-containing protein n=1 Tax=Pinctada imbricata TaxID=66713 RepID=A0AA89C0X3_PINIB|nr:hypothetical protein FSP39_008748 [Pinctada imbricata]
MTSSQDGVRRKLDFAEKPYTSKTFYLDIKTCKMKLKVTKRISDLGGRVEEFLCKEIHQLITDRDPDEGTQKSKTVLNEKKVGVPLSRGQALLMKATKFTADGNSSMATVLMDPLQKARNLGVQIQLVSIFLKESNKILYKVRQRSNHDELAGCDMEGFSPLTWKRNDKENINVVKLEDSDQMYKPLIKYFDNFPQVRYDDDLISPFDKKIILHRKSETINRYSAKRKSLPAAKKGGFCEACNYWFKCSLREHLNSDKHKKFVDQCHNYKDLDSIIVAMPSVMDFLSKFPSSLIQRDGERGEQSKASVYPSVLREKINSNVCLSDDVSLNLISTTSQAEHKYNNMEQSKSFAGVSADVNKECTSASVNLTLSTLVKNGNQHSSQGHEDIGKRRSYDSTCRSSEVDSEQTEIYYPGSAAESVTRDIDNEETRDSGTGPELVDDASVKGL